MKITKLTGINYLSNGDKLSALTVDVEDGLSILMNDLFNITMKPTKRVVDNVHRLLDLFDMTNTKGTFFILGEIAEHYPALVKDIVSRGHETGVHGYYHNQIFKLTYEKAIDDIGRAKKLIEDIGGAEVLGFRAPAFSVDEKNIWIFEVLTKLGFKYDSSVVPVKMKRYGWPGFNENISMLELNNGERIIEVPMSVSKMLGKKMPACGGGYLRYFPYSFTKFAFDEILKERPAILYIHPYEIDTAKYPEYFYKAKASLPVIQKARLSLYRLNKSTVFNKLNKLLADYKFVPVNNIINKY